MSYDLVVIGSGPGGYVASIRAAQLGMKVLCVEKEASFGGTCLNVGCIPSKALLESSDHFFKIKNEWKEHGINASEVTLGFDVMQARKNKIVTQLTGGIRMLLKKNKVESKTGTACINKDKSVTITSGNSKETVQAKNIIIATGSVPTSLPHLPIDQKTILDSTGALALQSIPEKFVVVGGGAIGLEMGSVYARLGSQVTVIEATDRIIPTMDADLSRGLMSALQKQGMKFKLDTKIKELTLVPSIPRLRSGTTLLGDPERSRRVEVIYETAGKEEKMEAEAVLISIGRKPNTEGLGCEEAGIQKDAKGFIVVDDHYQTSLPNIYAIGDVIGGAMLAHKASEEGVALVETLSGHAGHVNYFAIPSVVYTNPEVASVGFDEEELKAKGVQYKKSKFPFAANGRALSMGFKEGFVKMLADVKTDRLLGVHILAPHASDLIAEMVLALEYSASTEDVARTIHAHPTLSEALKEGALGLGSGTIHS